LLGLILGVPPPRRNTDPYSSPSLIQMRDELAAPPGAVCFKLGEPQGALEERRRLRDFLRQARSLIEDI
jgi:hypothetical protein